MSGTQSPLLEHATRDLASFASQLKFSDVPRKVVERLKLSLLDSIAAACSAPRCRGRARLHSSRRRKGRVPWRPCSAWAAGALKLTTASYRRPSGKNIHRLKDAKDEDERGVRPDPGFEVKLADVKADQIRQERRQKDMGAKPDNKPGKPQNKEANDPPGDPQLRKAVEYLQLQLSGGGTKG